MIDFSLFELLIIIAVAVLVIGPKDIPHIMVGFGRFIRRLRYMRFAFTQQFEDMMRESGVNPDVEGDIDALRKSVNFEAPAEPFSEQKAENENQKVEHKVLS